MGAVTAPRQTTPGWGCGRQVVRERERTVHSLVVRPIRVTLLSILTFASVDQEFRVLHGNVRVIYRRSTANEKSLDLCATWHLIG